MRLFIFKIIACDIARCTSFGGTIKPRLLKMERKEAYHFEVWMVDFRLRIYLRQCKSVIKLMIIKTQHSVLKIIIKKIRRSFNFWFVDQKTLWLTLLDLKKLNVAPQMNCCISVNNYILCFFRKKHFPLAHREKFQF